MVIELNYTIIQSVDQQKSAQFYCDLFGLKYQELFGGHFIAVQINASEPFEYGIHDR